MAAIKVFQSVQTSFKTLGLYSPHSDQIRSFNWRILFFSTFPPLLFASVFCYLLFEAKTIQVLFSLLWNKSLLIDFVIAALISWKYPQNQEYGQCFYVTVSLVLGILSSFETVRQISQILKLFQHFDDFIEKSWYIHATNFLQIKKSFNNSQFVS